MKVPLFNIELYFAQPRTQALRSDARTSLFVPARYERQNEEPGYEVALLHRNIFIV
jgi:hypothetical protein